MCSSCCTIIHFIGAYQGGLIINHWLHNCYEEQNIILLEKAKDDPMFSQRWENIVNATGSLLIAQKAFLANKKGWFRYMKRDIVPSDYESFLQDIKSCVQEAQLQAVLAANKELVSLYWRIGYEVLEKQKQQGWGTKVIERLSRDLHAAFPYTRGFSPRNLGYMKAFAKAYPDEAILQHAAKLPWYHLCILLEKVKDDQERMWYMQESIKYGWSRNVLTHQIDTKLYERKGKALTNFQRTLPDLQSDLAQEMLKDPYVFDFITTSDETKERNVQSALLAHIQQFLLELGVGFSFVGSNYHLVVGEEDYYLDLLFYHTNIRSYVVIELKSGSFRPEHTGQINFYLTAVDRQVKRSDDNPTIGIILCRTQSKITAEYALHNINSPIGIATYLTTALPEALKDKLPDIQELEARLQEPAAQLEEDSESA